MTPNQNMTPPADIHIIHKKKPNIPLFLLKAAAFLLLVVIAVIRVMIKDKKSGKHSCGGNCANCKSCRH